MHKPQRSTVFHPVTSSLLFFSTAIAQGQLKSERMRGSGHFGINGPSAASTNLHMQDVAKSCIPATILSINRSIFRSYCTRKFPNHLGRLGKYMPNVGKISLPYQVFILLPTQNVAPFCTSVMTPFARFITWRGSGQKSLPT